MIISRLERVASLRGTSAARSDMEGGYQVNTTEIVILSAALLVVAAMLWRTTGGRRSRCLDGQSALERSNPVTEFTNQRQDGTVLAKRSQTIADGIQIRPLAPRERERFLEAWRRCQSRFVDDPRAAVAEADRLVDQVLRARGYPVAEIEKRAVAISEAHPHVVSHYRAGHAIAARHSDGSASTEDLRRAFIHYRSLIDEMLDRYLVGKQH